MERSRLLAWMGREHARLLRDAIRSGVQRRFELVGIGSSERGAAGELAAMFDVRRMDDLRQAILHDDVDVLWLLAPGELDADSRRLIRQRRAQSSERFVCVTCEPVPGLVSLVQREAEEAQTAEFVPLFQRSPGWTAAQPMLEHAGTVRSVHVEFRCGGGEGTLFARLFDAMDLVSNVTGGVDSISARFAGPSLQPSPKGRGRVETAPEVLPGMIGTIGFVARAGEECIASGSVSSEAATWSRRVTIISDDGCLYVTDCEYEWSSAGGDGVEQSRVAEPMSAGELMAQAIVGVCGSQTPEVEHDLFEQLLGTCEAARLSARTGQAESPGRMLEMLRGV